MYGPLESNIHTVDSLQRSTSLGCLNGDGEGSGVKLDVIFHGEEA